MAYSSIIYSIAGRYAWPLISLVFLVFSSVTHAGEPIVRAVKSKSAGCVLEISSITRQSSKPFALRVETQNGWDLQLSTGVKGTAELVSSNGRVSIDKRVFDDSAEFQTAIASYLPATGPVHLTVKNGDDIFETMRFEHLGFDFIMEHMQRQCDLLQQSIKSKSVENKLRLTPRDWIIIYRAVDGVTGKQMTRPSAMFRTRLANHLMREALPPSRYLDTRSLALLRNQRGWVVPPHLDAISDVTQKSLIASLYGRWGIMNKNGEWMVQPHYSKGLMIGEGMFLLAQDGQWVLTADELNGRRTVSIDGSLGPCYEHICLHNIGRKFGYWTAKRGKVAPRFQQATPLRDGLAGVRVKDRWFLLNPRGKLQRLSKSVIDLKSPQNGFIIARLKDGQIGLINQTGTPVAFELAARRIRSPGTHLTAFRTNKWGYFHTSTGRVAISPRFQQASSFQHGIAVVRLTRTSSGFLREDEELITLEEGRAVKVLTDKIGVVEKDGRFGFIDIRKPKNKIDYIFDAVGQNHKALVAVELAGRWGVIDVTKLVDAK